MSVLMGYFLVAFNIHSGYVVSGSKFEVGTAILSQVDEFDRYALQRLYCAPYQAGVGV